MFQIFGSALISGKQKQYGVLVEATHWSFGDSNFYLRSQREQSFDERRLANVASANETHLEEQTSCFCHSGFNNRVSSHELTACLQGLVLKYLPKGPSGVYSFREFCS